MDNFLNAQILWNWNANQKSSSAQLTFIVRLHKLWFWLNITIMYRDEEINRFRPNYISWKMKLGSHMSEILKAICLVVRECEKPAELFSFWQLLGSFRSQTEIYYYRLNIEQTQPPSPPAVRVPALSSQSPPSLSPQVQGPAVFSFHIFSDRFVTNNNPTKMS